MIELYLIGGIVVALAFAFWVGYELGRQRASRPIMGSGQTMGSYRQAQQAGVISGAARDKALGSQPPVQFRDEPLDPKEFGQ